MRHDWDRPHREAALVHDLETMGAVHLEPPRRIGFERRKTRGTVNPRPVSPGGGFYSEEEWFGGPEAKK